MPTVSIIGMGRVGNALARALTSPYSVVGRYGRSTEDERSIVNLEDAKALHSDFVAICTNDDSIPEVVRSLLSKTLDHPIVLHMSGSLSSDVLSELREKGCKVASMHPLVAITGSSDASVFNGAYFCIEGDDLAVTHASNLAINLGGIPTTIRTEEKPLYHAAAVMAAGHLVALIDMAKELMHGSGIDERSSLNMLRPLINSVIDSVFEQGTERSLTGTYARGDIQTAKGHLAALDLLEDKVTREVFIDLALRSLKLGKLSGLDYAKAAELEGLLTVAKNSDEL